MGNVPAGVPSSSRSSPAPALPRWCRLPLGLPCCQPVPGADPSDAQGLCQRQRGWLRGLRTLPLKEACCQPLRHVLPHAHCCHIQGPGLEGPQATQPRPTLEGPKGHQRAEGTLSSCCCGLMTDTAAPKQTRARLKLYFTHIDHCFTLSTRGQGKPRSPRGTGQRHRDVHEPHSPGPQNFLWSCSEPSPPPWIKSS